MHPQWICFPQDSQHLQPEAFKWYVSQNFPSLKAEEHRSQRSAKSPVRQSQPCLGTSKAVLHVELKQTFADPEDEAINSRNKQTQKLSQQSSTLTENLER